MTKHINNNLNSKQSESQKEAILKHLLKGRPLTGLQALSICGSMKASTRISELRRMNWPIQDAWVRIENGKRIKKYFL
jgi:hypothetical protein